jgi:hypothetical protein
MPSSLPKSFALAGITLLVGSTAPADAQCEAPKYVSGAWAANDGGTYWLHLVGNTIWWVGMSGDNGGCNDTNLIPAER